MNWSDPDLKNHVDSEEMLNISLFLDKFTIINVDSFTNDKYKLKRNPGYSSISIFHPSLSKLSDISISYKNSFNVENKNTKLIGKPMTKSYNVYKRVDFYQFLLFFNELFSITEFENGSNSSTITYPGNHVMTQIFSDIMTNKSCPSMRNVNKIEDIEEITNMLSTSTNANYDLTNLASEKIYISISDFKKLIDMPIFKTYLLNQLTKNLKQIKNINIATLNEMLSKMLNEIKNYIAINAEEEK